MTEVEKYILGVKVNFGLSMEDVVKRAVDLLAKKGTHYICTTNPEFIVDAQKDIEFKQIINNSTLSVPDGSGVVFAYEYLTRVALLTPGLLYPLKSFLIGISIPILAKEKPPVTQGVSLMLHLCEYASKNRLTVGLIGGWPKDKLGRPVKSATFNMAFQTSEILKKRYPGLNIVLAESNIRHAESFDTESRAKLLSLYDKEIDLLFVAFGHPKQEKWIVRNSSLLKAKLSIGVGGSFDSICNGDFENATRYSKHNVEWLYRLIKQPWRYKRMLKALIVFPLLVFSSTLSRYTS